jgi:glycosyltransferase involved in cell wall biosynthesis
VLSFSIVTPSYNQGRYLAATIESVIGQEGDFTIDYVITDGGSKDNSVEIIRDYEQRLASGTWPVRCRGITYRWLSERDGGQSDAIQKGFAMATGDVLAWLNSDDTYAPGALQIAANVLADTNVSVIYGKSHFTDENGTVVGRYRTEPFDSQRLAVFNFIAQPSVFFRKNAFERVGGIEASLHYVMDFDLWIRMARELRFVYVPEFLSTFRLHDESKTVSRSHALANSKETLEQIHRHFGWAPLNRVYGYAHQVVRSRLPAFDNELLLIALSLPVAAATYLRLNRGIRLADLRMLNATNLKKLVMKPDDLAKHPEV